jgi:uncharacterized protein (DUF1697 family)
VTQAVPPFRQIALLRGVNVGASTRVPMAHLRSMVEALGGSDVVTYVNSGNVAYSVGTASGELSGDLARRIHSELGVTTTVVTVDAAKLDRIIADMPFIADDDSKLGVVFMHAVPKSIESPAEFEPDRVQAGEYAVYLDVPNGFGKTKFSPAWFKKNLPPESTTRNWRTVLKLRELLEP